MNRHLLHKGFSLVELLLVLGIIALLISLLLPAMATLRQEARRRVCQSEMRQLSVLVTMYCSDNHGRMPFLYTARADGNWESPSGKVLSPEWALTAHSYWPMTMFDEFGESMYADILLCPDDTLSLAYRAEMADLAGVPESEVQAGAARGLSTSLFLNSNALHEDRDHWEDWYFRVAAIHEAPFPSQKSFLVEGEPFHNYPYVPTIWPNGYQLMASALDGSVRWRPSLDASDPIQLGINPLGLPDALLDRTKPIFQFTRDGIRGIDW